MINSEKLKQRMKEQNVSQKELAAKLGIEPSSFNCKINNKRSIDVDEAFIIQDALSIPDEEFRSYFFS